MIEAILKHMGGPEDTTPEALKPVVDKANASMNEELRKEENALTRIPAYVASTLLDGDTVLLDQHQVDLKETETSYNILFFGCFPQSDHPEVKTYLVIDHHRIGGIGGRDVKREAWATANIGTAMDKYIQLSEWASSQS